MADGQPLAFARSIFTVPERRFPRPSRNFWSLSTWELLNLPLHDILDLPRELLRQCGVAPQSLERALAPHVVQTVGMADMLLGNGIRRSPQYLIASTRHYSWPKAAGTSSLRELRDLK